MSPIHLNARMRRMLRGRRECAEIRELLSDFVDEEIAPDAHRRVEEHVSFCRPCRQVMANLRQSLTSLRRLGDMPTQDVDDEAATVARLRAAWRDDAA